MSIDHEPLVQILLATYEGETFLSPLLESLLDQTYSKIQILIRDDCSKDNTKNILKDYQKKYPDQIKILDSFENKGVVTNFSHLIESSNAHYVMCADQDDVWHANKVEVTLHSMLALEKQIGREKPILVHTDLMVVDEELKIIEDSFWQYQNLRPAHSNFPGLLVQNTVTGCAMMMNRALVEKVTPIPSEVAMHDWWIALVASCFGHIEPLDVATICYRQHAKNDTGAKKYGLASLLNKKNMRVSDKPIKQAGHFFLRFENELESKNRQILKGYLDSQKASFIKRKLYLFRHGMIKHGFLRQLKQLILE